MAMTSEVKNQPLICFKIMSYILNLIGNKIMLTSNFDIATNQDTSYGFKK